MPLEGVKPVTTIKRYDRQQNKKIDVDFPESIKFYNRFMGGVDLADSLISLYRTEIRSKKWYLKIFFYILDLSVVNGWLLYRRDCNYFKIEAKNQYNLLDLKSELANILCQKGLRCNVRGRPRSTEIEHGLSEKRKRGPTVSVPPKEVRLDQTSHWTIFSEKKGRCRKPGCSNTPKVMCQKCQVNLCFTTTNNCFYDGHNK